MRTNKQVIENLIEYYLTQDPKDVARLMANAMIDYNRIFYYKTLSQDERTRLNACVLMNARALQKFIKEGAKGDLKIHNIGEDENG